MRPYGKMNRALKREWIKRLISGKYSQTHGVLVRRKANGRLSYCCLGVLAGPAMGGIVENEHISTAAKGLTFSNLGVLGRPIRKHIRLSTGAMLRLVELNDERDGSGNYINNFRVIAAWIRKHL